MKSLTTLALVLIISFETYCQTQSREFSVLADKYKSGSITKEQYMNLRKNWIEMIKDHGYPKLPYDSVNDRLVFDAVVALPGIPQRVIMKRILELSAITFGNLNSVLNYEDDDEGKLVLKGFSPIPFLDAYEGLFWSKSVSLNTYRCYFTLVFTIKEGKMKMEFRNMEYNFSFSYVDFVGTFAHTAYGEKTVPISDLWPVTKYPPIKWRGCLSLLQRTSSTFESQVSAYKDYILDHRKDYEF